MKNTAAELEQIVIEFSGKLKALPDYELNARPNPKKWSKKEVLGHLIDSALNNHRRFIVGQYETSTSKIVYDQDFWVVANHYQEMKKEDIIALWSLINERISAVLRTMSPQNYGRQSDTGKESIQLHTIEWLAPDYVKHLKHHLNQIFPGSFDIVYK